MNLQLVVNILPEEIGQFSNPEQELAYERFIQLQEEFKTITQTVMTVDRYEGDGLSGGVDRSPKKRGDVLLIDAWVPEGGNQIFRGQVRCVPMVASESYQEYDICSFDPEDMNSWDRVKLVHMGLAVTTDRGSANENTSIYFYTEKDDSGKPIERYLKKDIDNHTCQEVVVCKESGEIQYVEYSNYYAMEAPVWS